MSNLFCKRCEDWIGFNRKTDFVDGHCTLCQLQQERDTARAEVEQLKIKLKKEPKREPKRTGKKVDVQGRWDEKHDIEYLGDAYEMSDGTWRCLANVQGMLALVEVKIREIPVEVEDNR